MCQTVSLHEGVSRCVFLACIGTKSLSSYMGSSPSRELGVFSLFSCLCHVFVVFVKGAVCVCMREESV